MVYGHVTGGTDKAVLQAGSSGGSSGSSSGRADPGARVGSGSRLARPGSPVRSGPVQISGPGPEKIPCCWIPMIEKGYSFIFLVYLCDLIGLLPFKRHWRAFFIYS